MRPWLKHVLRITRIASGAALLLAGAALLVLPGPGIPMVLGALILLETEFHWARRLRARLNGDARRGASSLRSAAGWLFSRAAYSLALLPVLTDWVDTGHWPHHPREFVTEIFVGAVIVFGVWRLHRRGDRFRSLAQTDSLTGLGNRARFRADIEAAADDAHSFGRIALETPREPQQSHASGIVNIAGNRTVANG